VGRFGGGGGGPGRAVCKQHKKWISGNAIVRPGEIPAFDCCKNDDLAGFPFLRWSAVIPSRRQVIRHERIVESRKTPPRRRVLGVLPGHQVRRSNRLSSAFRRVAPAQPSRNRRCRCLARLLSYAFCFRGISLIRFLKADRSRSTSTAAAIVIAIDSHGAGRPR